MKSRERFPVHLLRDRIVAISCLSPTWEGTWQGVIDGQRRFKHGAVIFPDVPAESVLGCVEEWEGNSPEYAQRFSTLVQICSQRLKPILTKLLAQNKSARCRIFIASSHGDPALITELLTNNRKLDAFVQRRLIFDNLLFAVQSLAGNRIPVSVVHGACASALVAVAQGAMAIRRGLLDVAIVIAADSLSKVAYVGFKNVGAMSLDGCRPFDRQRDGMTASEGGVGFLLINSETISSDEPYTVVLGGAYNCDGQGAVEPSSDGLFNVLEDVCIRSSTSPRSIDCVYWHGTGTKRNDEVEAVTSQRFWRNEALRPLGTSLKGSLGHSMGAASAFSVAAACNSLSTGYLPPTAGLSECEYQHMNIVQDRVASGEFATALCVAMGFGGINAAVLLGKPM